MVYGNKFPEYIEMSGVWEGHISDLLAYHLWDDLDA